MLNLRTTTLLCFLTTLVALSAAGCDGNNEGDGAEGGGQKLVPPSDPGDPSDFETLEACRLAEPCPESTTQLIENISRNLDPSRSRCLLQGLRDRTPGRYFYTTDHAFSNGGVGARHLLVVSADGSVAYAHNDYGPGTTSGQPAERCELADANYFASCLTALEGVSKDDSLSDDVNDAAWSCLFGTGPTTEPSRLAWLASCAPEAPRCE